MARNPTLLLAVLLYENDALYSISLLLLGNQPVAVTNDS